MNNPTNQTNLKEKLDNFLNRACQAEAEGNKEEADRLLSLALRCDELSRPNINNDAGDIQQATSEKNNQLLVKVRIQEADHETQNENK